MVLSDYTSYSTQLQNCIHEGVGRGGKESFVTLSGGFSSKEQVLNCFTI